MILANVMDECWTSFFHHAGQSGHFFFKKLFMTSALREQAYAQTSGTILAVLIRCV